MAKADTAILARVSTVEQVRVGHSIAEQLEYCHSYCERKGWTAIEPDYKQEGGHSDDINYPALEQLLTDVVAGKVKRVVVQYTDRLARGDNFPFLVKWLWDWDVDLYSSDFPEGRGEAADYVAGLQGPAGRMFLRKLRQRTREGLAQAKKEGEHPGRPVAGFRWEGSHLVPDESKPKTWAAKRNAHAYRAGGEEGLLDFIHGKTKKTAVRIERSRTRKLEAQRTFRIWLEEHRPLRSERASL